MEIHKTDINLIVNPRAGGLNRWTSEGLANLLRKQGLNVLQVLSAAAEEDLALVARPEIAQGAQLLVVAGGDGTINAVVQNIVESPVSLGILPLGTFNHFAKDLQIPLGIEEAARVIAGGKTTLIDVGEVNGRVFVNNSSLGIYPQILSWRKKEQRMGLNKWASLLWATIIALRRPPLLQMRLIANDREFVLRTPLVFIGNNKYQTYGHTMGSRLCLDSGRLWVYLARALSGRQLIGLAFKALFGRLQGEKQFESICVTEVRIETRRSRLMVSFDGEFALMKSPLTYRIRPGGLRVLVP